MKLFKHKTTYSGIAAACLLFFSCEKEAFVEANLDPGAIYEISPENQFLAASIQVSNDFEYFYDVYRKLNYWLQYTTPSVGNGPNFNLPGAQFNYRYNNLYNNVGPKLIDAIDIIDQMPEEEKAKYVYQKNIARILLAYYTFYTSDINGSIPYSEAFMARYGGTLTPTYDTQQALFDLLNQQLKDATAVLKSNQTVEQSNLGNNDPFFGGAVENWIKAANALRLRIATRFMATDEAKLQAIVDDVLVDGMQMATVDDSWEFKAGPTYADAGSNWNPNAGFIAAKPIVDFMKSTADPRLKIYYKPNEADGEYVGGFPSPDDPGKAENRQLYENEDNFSLLQHRLFAPNFDEGDGAGTGAAFFPLITYPEYCFIRADLAARGYSEDNAEEWYKKGVYASLDYYDAHALSSGIPSYATMTTAQKDDYYDHPAVKYSAANALEQIAVQAYFDFYRNPFEAWSWWKRTGYPKTSSSVFAWSKLMANGTELVLPRRTSISYLPTSDLNYENQQSAIQAMMQDPGYGSGPGDPFGRVWWDKE